MRVHDENRAIHFNFAVVFEQFGTRPVHTPARIWETPMGFIFRTAFWLALAVVIVPPEARLGGDDTSELEQLDVKAVIDEAGHAAWAISQSALNTCDHNPKLCEAGQQLVDTTFATANAVINDVKNTMRGGKEHPRLRTKSAPHRTKKIQARVE